MVFDKILLVDDDPSAIQLMARVLSGVGQLRFATSGEVALKLALESPPDLILLDAEMPGMSGFEVLSALRADPDLVDVPVIFVTSHCEAAFEIAGFDKGAADFIAKPVNPALVLARVKMQLRVKRMSDELRRIATIDVLTGVANRRRFNEALDREWRRTCRSGEPISLLMIDVDHFKAFNDRYGHQTGDACLRSIAQTLAVAAVRPADLVARYGGEEFVVLLPQTPRSGAQQVADRVADAIEGLEIAHAASPTSNHVTASVGVACYDDVSVCWVPPSAKLRVQAASRAPCGPSDLLQAADAALYSAKHSGRAQVCFLDIDDAYPPKDVREFAPPARPARASAQA